MSKIALIFISLYLFVSCSFKVEPNDWQYKSAYYFSLYKNNFLNANDLLAKNDLKRAVQNAKRSADFTTLARVYLGECALNISIGIDDKCDKYENISELLESKKLDAYYGLITNDIKINQIKLLPLEYQNYVKYSKKLDFKSAQKSIFNKNKVTATFLMAALIRDMLSQNARKKLIELASFHGYKQVVIFWLKESRKYTKDVKELQLLNKKIAILEK